MPVIANQCQVAGFTSPLGSQNEVAGTRHRHSTKDDFQKLLFRMVSSRTFVTGRGALPFWSSMKPQLIVTISRSESAVARATGATPRKDCRHRLEHRRAVVRDAEEPRHSVPFL